ncbi:MAG: DnaJ domain-containing protein [Phycisphaerales bacterium]
MSSIPTHYELLQVAPAATAAQIRAAYRALARTLHPDISKAKDATAVFARITVAYETLSDAAKRREYDQSLLKRTAPELKPEDLRPHYTWTNIADNGARVANIDDEWFEDVYSAFFATRLASTSDASPSSDDKQRNSPQSSQRNAASRTTRRQNPDA